MKNYKITNLKTNAYHLLNEEEKERFLKINNRWFYYSQEIKEVTEIEKRKKLENFCFTLIAVLLCAASYLLLCELLNAI
jgi:glucan-binding YG repeat protein